MTPPMPFALLVIVGVAAFFIWSMRQRELFCLSVREGKTLLVRGRVPGGLLSDISDAMRASPPIRRAKIVAYRGEGGVQLDLSGTIDDGRAQRLRNILGIYPMSRLSAAPIANDRTIGQILGIVWLAWMLDRSGRH